MPLSPERKKFIDGLSQYDMAYKIRFAPIGDVLFSDSESYAYFHEIFDRRGGMTPEISKSLGWERR
jgi:hypothetical protein